MTETLLLAKMDEAFSLYFNQQLTFRQFRFRLDNIEAALEILRNKRVA